MISLLLHQSRTAVQLNAQNSLGGLALLIAVLLAFVLGRWAWNDGQARGRSGFAAMILVVFCSFPLGWLLWLVLRPALLPPDSGVNTGFDLERHRLQ